MGRLAVRLAPGRIGCLARAPCRCPRSRCWGPANGKRARGAAPVVDPMCRAPVRLALANIMALARSSRYGSRISGVMLAARCPRAARTMRGSEQIDRRRAVRIAGGDVSASARCLISRGDRKAGPFGEAGQTSPGRRIVQRFEAVRSARTYEFGLSARTRQVASNASPVGPIRPGEIICSQNELSLDRQIIPVVKFGAFVIAQIGFGFFFFHISTLREASGMVNLP
jgi:hypothetical protein